MFNVMSFRLCSDTGLETYYPFVTKLCNHSHSSRMERTFPVSCSSKKTAVWL